MAKGATSKWKAKLAKAKASARTRVANLKQGERTKQVSALGGALAAGALDGAQVSLEIGEIDIPAGLVAGLPIVMFGGKFSPLLEGAGLGAACFGVGAMMADYVAGMDWTASAEVSGVEAVPEAEAAAAK